MADPHNADLDALERLAALHKDGFLTREEFETEKAKLYARPVTESPGVGVPSEPPVIVAPPMVHGYREAPAGTPKSSSSIAWIGPVIAVFFVVAISAYGLNQNNRSGIVVGGRGMSKSEANDALDEMYEFAKNGRAGDPSSFDTSTPAKSQLVRDLQEKIKKMKDAHDLYLQETASLDFEKIFNLERLSSKAGREKSTSELDRYAELTEAYYEKNLASIEDIEAWSVSVSKRKPTKAESTKESITALKRDYGKLFSLGQRIIDVCHKYRPSYDKKNKQILFETDQGVAAFNNALDAFGAFAEKVDKLEKDLLKQGNESMQEDLSILGSK